MLELINVTHGNAYRYLLESMDEACNEPYVSIADQKDVFLQVR